MSKVLAVLLELKECSDYWSDYAVPIGIHELIDAAIAELLAQPEQDATTDKPTATATAGAVMPNGVCVSNVYDAYEAGRQSAMVEQKPEQIKQKQEAVRYEYQDSDGEWQQFESKERYINNQKWGEPTRVLYTSLPKREPLTGKEISQTTKGMSEFGADMFKAGIAAAEKAHGIVE